MKALTLYEPWATLMALGHKRIETRSWSTPYHGLVAIHAGKKLDADDRDLLNYSIKRAADSVPPAPGFEWHLYGKLLHEAGIRDASELPLGHVVAVGFLGVVMKTGSPELTDQLNLSIRPHERALGDYSTGRYGWVFSRFVRLPVPLPCRGNRMLWDLPPDVAEAATVQYKAGISIFGPEGPAR